MEVLALSSSRVDNGGFLQNALSYFQSFLGNETLNIAFIPFAAIQRTYDEYSTAVRDALSTLSYTITTATPETAAHVIKNADAIMVGGGNTFKLLHDIYHYDLFELIQDKVKNGTPYIGWSAGANLAGKSISTTNDMPVIQPRSFAAFNFLPFQINPHYISQQLEGHNGETRDQRLEEFVLLNPSIPVVGLPEGTGLQLANENLELLGDKEGIVFGYEENIGITKTIIARRANLSLLL
jgi:dipeptidase E